MAGPPRRSTSCARPTRRRCSRRGRTAPRGAPVLHPRGVGPDPRPRRRRLRPVGAASKPTPARRRRRPSCSHAIKAALPHTVTRVFYGSTEAGPGTARSADERPRAQAGQRRRRRSRASRCASTNEGEVCLRSPLLMDGYFDDPDATADALDATAGTTPAISARSTTRATSRSSAALRDVIRTGGETVAPPEVEAVLGDPSRRRRGRGRRRARPAVGRDRDRGGRARARRVGRRRSRRSGRTARAGSPASSTPAGSRSSTRLPRTAATGQIQRTLLVERLQQASEPTSGWAMRHGPGVGSE